MVDREEPGQEGTAPSSPASDGEKDQQPAPKLAKDRNCPFCGQAFTSSSLGRHLDLYIKPKNPKPADGVHDVEEIKKLRGGITRRQPRGSLKGTAARRDESTEAPEHPNHDRDSLKDASTSNKVSDETPVTSPGRSRQGSARGTFINAPSWQSTGVINNIPPRAPSRSIADVSAMGQAQRVQDMRRDQSSGQRIQRPEPESNNAWKLQEQAETGRAAEMALRELLGSLQAARRKVEPGPIYEDFDFFALSFPGLCLAILPPPTTLFSPAPFPSAESWSLKPPGAQQSDVLHRLFNDRVKEMRRVTPDHPSDTAYFRHSAHIQGAFENWRLMSEQDKQAAWTLEALRALTTSRDVNNKLKTRVANAEQHASHLEAQYDRLSRCQLPREWLVRPPGTLPMTSSIANEVHKQYPHLDGSDENYEPEAVLSKWRDVVRSVSRPQRQPSTNVQTYAASSIRPDHSADSLQSSMVMSGAVFGVGGPLPRATDNHGVHINSQTPREAVNYETPPQPGTVLEDEDQQPQSTSPYTYPFQPPEDDDEDLANEDVSSVLDTSLTNFVDRNALAKQRRFVQGSFSGGSSGSPGTFGKFKVNGSGPQSPRVNANGKRVAEDRCTGMNKNQRT